MLKLIFINFIQKHCHSGLDHREIAKQISPSKNQKRIISII